MGGGEKETASAGICLVTILFIINTRVSLVSKEVHMQLPFSRQTPNLSYLTAGHTANPIRCSPCHTINAPDIYRQSPSGGFQSRQIRTSPYVRHLPNERPIHTFPHATALGHFTFDRINEKPSDVSVIKAPSFNFPAQNATQQFN